MSILCLLGGPCLLGATPAQAQGGDSPQHRLLVSSHGVSAPAKLVAFCRTETPQPVGRAPGLCWDGPNIPTPTPSVPAHGGGAVQLVAGVRVDEIIAVLPPLDGPPSSAVPLRVVPADTSGRSFIAVLPPGPPLPLLSIGIRYSGVAGAGGSSESGDAAFTIGLTEHLHGKATPGQVTARARARCARPRGRRHSCRLYQRGRIEPPLAPATDCRGGRVLVELVARGRTVLRARARTSSDCRYRLRGRRFSLPRGAKRVKVRTRFLGSSALAGGDARSIRIRPVFR